MELDNFLQSVQFWPSNGLTFFLDSLSIIPFQIRRFNIRSLFSDVTRSCLLYISLPSFFIVRLLFCSRSAYYRAYRFTLFRVSSFCQDS